MSLFNKRLIKPKTTTLYKYNVIFKSVDGCEHKFNNMYYADPNAIACSVGEYYLLHKNFLRDEDDIYYPIGNIVSIKFELADKIENVVELDYHVFYSPNEIEIYNEED